MKFQSSWIRKASNKFPEFWHDSLGIFLAWPYVRHVGYRFGHSPKQSTLEFSGRGIEVLIDFLAYNISCGLLTTVTNTVCIAAAFIFLVDGLSLYSYVLQPVANSQQPATSDQLAWETLGIGYSTFRAWHYRRKPKSCGEQSHRDTLCTTWITWPSSPRT